MREFLEALWRGSSFGELRYPADGNMQQLFFQLPGQIPQAIETAAGLDEGGFDVYFGVAPRTFRGGKAEDVVPVTTTLWADVDAKHVNGSKTLALQGLTSLPQAPSIIVDSGHGYHAYWLLREPEAWDLAVAAMKNLAREVRGDAVYDRSRILRIPGTRNHKVPQKPEPVRLMRFDITRRYRIDDFDLDDHTTPFYSAQKRGQELALWAHGEIPVWLTELIEAGAPKGQRSELCFKVVLWLVRYGKTDEEIDDIFAGHSAGIGEKYAELGKNGPRWLQRTIKAAREAA